MPILNVRNIGSVGVNSDIEPWDLPPDALSDGINYRLSANKLQSVGGTRPVAPPSGDQLGHITQSTDFSGNSTWVLCGENSIKLYDGQSFADIGSSLVRDARFANLDPAKWSSCRIGQVVFLNHPQLYPVYWVDGQGSADPAQPLPWHIGADDEGNLLTETWDDVGNSCRIIRAHKNFLFALGMQEGAEEYRDKIWWSHPAEPNGIPFSWRPSSEQTDSIAGWVSLGRGGSIVGGESLRDSFVVYSEQAINVMDFTGDALGWRRRTVSSAAGLASQEALVEVQGTHFFISPGDIQTFDGNSIGSIMHNRLRKRFASRTNTEALGNSWAAHNPAFNEIWFAVPETGDDIPRIAYAFNYRDNNWGIRDLERPFRHAHFGVTPQESVSSWSSFGETWDETRAAWAMSGGALFNSNLLGVTGEEIHDIDLLNETFSDDFTSLEDKVWNQASGTWDERSVSWDKVDSRFDGRVWEQINDSWDSKTAGWDESDDVYYNKVWSAITEAWDDSTLSWDEVDPRLGYKRSPTIIRRTDMPIGGHAANTTITRIYPLVEGTAPIEIRVGSQQKAGGPIKWAGDYRTFIPGTDHKVDVRTTGELHCYEIKSEGGSFFNLTGMDIEFVPAGKR